MQYRSSDVVVVGGGVIGTAAAWRCAQRGLTVTLVDADHHSIGRGDVPRAAWYTAAGMLAPVTELTFTETPLLRLNLASHDRWGQFASELDRLTGLRTGYTECRTIQAAWDAADLAELRDLAAFGTDSGPEFRMLTSHQLRSRQPGLAPGLPGALLAESDHQVDPRLLHQALGEAAATAGVTAVAGTAQLAVSDARVGGVRVAGTDDWYPADTVVVAGGAWSSRIDGLDPAQRPEVRPVKGQTIRVRLPGPPRLEHVVRARIKGNPIYVLARADGEYVIGASVEEAGFDQTPRTGAVYELLRDAISLVPELGESTLQEICTGLRPASRDNAPLIGPTEIDGLIFATGHYRNGILLAPVTAEAVADLASTGTVPEVVTPFAPTRFTKAAA